MRPQKGFSLIEVLITSLVISVGLHGIAGIVANSLKSNQSSYTRTQASLLANDMIDRMRANRRSASVDNYNLALTATPSGAGVVANDLIDWRNTLASTLPAGTGAVVLDAVTLRVSVTVQWNNSRVAGGSGTQQIVVESIL